MEEKQIPFELKSITIGNPVTIILENPEPVTMVLENGQILETVKWGTEIDLNNPQ